MLQGLRTVIYHVEDLQKAKDWYAKVLSFQPYFEQPYYVGFNVGGFELGLDPDISQLSKGNNVIAYWHVANAESTLKRLMEFGASKFNDIQDVGGGIRVASVYDPFGNVLGIIEDPNFKV